MKIICNGLIYLGKNNFCEALLIDKGRIVRTGSRKDILELAPAGTEKTDAGGALVLPAFNDSHLHLMSIGRRAGYFECEGAQSVDEVIARGKKAANPASAAYIRGAGLNPDHFTSGEKRDLNRYDLDKISNEKPVIITRHCGHIFYCNSAALKQAGLNESAPEVEGGSTDRDENGKPTGVLRENAGNLIMDSLPKPSNEEMKNCLRLAMKKAFSFGITSCGSQDTNGPDLENVLEIYGEIYDESKKSGIPALRVNLQCGVSINNMDYLDACIKRKNQPNKFPDDRDFGSFLKIQSIKLFVDGSLGGHTAWMRQPYRDKPEVYGYPVIDQESLNRLVQKAAAGNMQAVIHAIGDAGMDSAIAAIEKVTGPGYNPLRHGIIHCQITSPDLLERMAKNRIHALVQPIFLKDDFSILESRVGTELASTSYAWGSMHKMGIPVSYGTDAPISSLDPLPCLESAIRRRVSSGIFCPDERVDIHTAIEAYTAASAYANFNEDSLGHIREGNFADLVFLDKDIFTIQPEDIGKTKVIKTMCAGETVYSP